MWIWQKRGAIHARKDSTLTVKQQENISKYKPSQTVKCMINQVKKNPKCTVKDILSNSIQY